LQRTAALREGSPAKQRSSHKLLIISLSSVVKKLPVYRVRIGFSCCVERLPLIARKIANSGSERSNLCPPLANDGSRSLLVRQRVPHLDASIAFFCAGLSRDIPMAFKIPNKRSNKTKRKSESHMNQHSALLSLSSLVFYSHLALIS
jgi:hypothetical protein